MWRPVLVRLALIASLPPLVIGSPDGVNRVGRRVAMKPGAAVRVDGREIDAGSDRRIYTIEAARGPWSWIVSEDRRGWVRTADLMPEEESESLRPILEAGRAIRPLSRAMRPPKPDEWLASHREEGQTFDAYRSSRPNIPTRSRGTIYIQALGTIPANRRGLLDDTAEYLSIFYGIPVKTLAPDPLASLPASARRTRGFSEPQIDTLYLLDMLKPRVPADGVALLGLTASDVWPNAKAGRTWNFVFGQASLRDRVGVWSLSRLGDPDFQPDLLRLRTLKIAGHETGHMLGLQHCTAYDCGMNGSNHLRESDGQPLGFCSECEMKVWWACGVDPIARYERLAAFASARGMTNDAAAWIAARGRLIAAKARSGTAASND